MKAAYDSTNLGIKRFIYEGVIYNILKLTTQHLNVGTTRRYQVMLLRESKLCCMYSFVSL